MDENYLDNLLNEVSLDKEMDSQIEDELDNLMMEEKQRRQYENAISREDAFDMGLVQDANLITGDDELHFTEDQMEELDQLNNLADLDIGDLDFSDIDFNALDVTNVDNMGEDAVNDVLKDFEGDLEVDNFYNGEDSARQPYSDVSENADLNVDTFDTDTFLDNLLEETGMTENSPVETENPSGGMDSLFAETENPSGGMDSLFAGTENPSEGMDSLFAGTESQTSSEGGQEELDDLLSLLDMEDSLGTEVDTFDTAGVKEKEESYAGSEEGPDNGETPEKPMSSKDKFMRLLFGDPDEDDIISEEEIAAAAAKKAAKKAKKEAKKEAQQAEKKEKADAAKQEKAAKNNIKKQAADEKKRVKAEKKAARKAEEAANAEPEKKLNKPAVVFIFTLFLGGTLLFYLATNNFNYTLAIENATNYFANQKYRSAYNEIIGVEVKEEDQDLEDRIYTVMYVERLYESYENNIKLGREEKALDSLLRGVDKYYEYYDEAVKLGITGDLDYSFAQIQNALLQNYGIAVEQAVEINALENYEYVERVNSYIISEE